MKNFCLLAIAAALLTACANPSITNLQTARLRQVRSTPIYVARFDGNPGFVDEATDMFIAELQKNARREIIQGDSIRQETSDIAGGGNIAPKAEGIAKAKAAGADLLILGKVTSHKTEGALNGFVTVRIVETRSGRIIGTVHRPSGLLIAYSEHQCVLAAAKRVAAAVNRAL
ncbi:MAG: hypothetical protein RLZZ253_2953 [Verrucomicrobiota bacterium]|jgi:curli biogenesis system outer membrane secretion channel CsgG